MFRLIARSTSAAPRFATKQKLVSIPSSKLISHREIQPSRNFFAQVAVRPMKLTFSKVCLISAYLDLLIKISSEFLISAFELFRRIFTRLPTSKI